jgi:outer membrane protein OmpA-like peptidoglycan-associated protein
MRILVGLGVLVLVGLVGCSTPSPGPGGTAPGSSAPGSAPKQTLAAEQRRLADLFKGTPVVVETPKEGSLRIAVPLEFAFDKGRFVVKPPLGKVLDLVARSQRAEPTRFAVSAPTDPQSKALLLATERANSTRDYLVARGLAPTRVTVTALASGDSVVILITEPPAP